MASAAVVNGVDEEAEVDGEEQTHSVEAEEATKASMGSATTVAKWDIVRLSAAAERLGSVGCV